MDWFYGDGDAPKEPRGGDVDEPVTDAISNYLDWLYGEK